MMALFASFMDQAKDFITRGFAVIGATIVGAILLGFIINFFTQLIWGKKLPTGMSRFVRVVGGLSSGFVVGMFVFGGGGGWGTGGGSGSATTKGTLPDANALTADPLQGPAFSRIEVTMLGGKRVVAEKFYRVYGHAGSKTFKELKEILQSEPVRPDANQLIVRIYEDSIAQDHPAVHELESWAAENKWRVTLEKIPNTIPDVAGEKS